MNPTCPFCTLPDSRILTANEHGSVIRDGFPISPGHTLIIPRRHVGSFFAVSAEERNCLLQLLDGAKLMLDREFKPDIGSNFNNN